MRLPGIGSGLSAAIDEIDRTGRLSQLDRLRGESRPEALFQAVPGVGSALARVLHEELDVDSLEALEVAAHDFNPEKRAWLPDMHTERDGWHFTVLFSNTARAHELGRTEDWVVIYFYDGEHEEGQHTVVTETQGRLKGRRVVRGREAECRLLQE